MKSEDDPEARIRELEQPLAEAARASEAGENPQPSKWAPPPGAAMPPPTGPPMPPPSSLPYSGSFPGPSPALYSRSNRTWWIIAGVFVIGMIALPVAIFLFTAHQVSRSGITALLPIPSISSEAPTPSGAMTQTRAAPSTSLTAAPTAPKGGNLSVAGINVSRTIACNDSSVSVSGVSNTVVITGHLCESQRLRCPEQGDGPGRRQHSSFRLQQRDHLPCRFAAHRPVRPGKRDPEGLTRQTVSSR